MLIQITNVMNSYRKISVINSCDTAPDTKNGELVTTKKNKETHGLGTKSIKKIVDKTETMGTKALAACELYTITNDEAYLTDAYLATKIVMNCQEKENAPINGFFYEDQMHKYILFSYIFPLLKIFFY